MGKPHIAIIFGVSGQDGAYLAQLLLTKGYIVHGVSRDAESTSFERLARLGILGQVQLHSGNLGEFRSVLSLMNKVKPSEIYNLAGQSSVSLSFELPAETFDSIAIGTINILEYLRLAGSDIRFFQAVSSECFGNTDQPANELTPFHPRSPYAMAKAASFWANAIYREAYGIYVSSGILSNHESPLRPQRFVTKKIVSTAVKIAGGSREKLVLGNMQIARDWGWAPEYVDAMWRILQADQSEDFVIATGETKTLVEFVVAVFELLGLDWRNHVVTADYLLRPSEMMRVELDPSRSFKKLGWAAASKMRDVAARLVDCETHGGYGPVPWDAAGM
jgi:GDPmannose 4,6-dehydratase